MENNQQNITIWKNICQELSRTIPSTYYGAWLNTHQLNKIESIDDETIKIIILTPSAFHALKFEQLLGEQIKQILIRKFNKKIILKFKIYQKRNRNSNKNS